MQTIQMTINKDLVKAVDRIVKKLKTTRSAFTRDALRDAIENFQQKQLEARHKRGYDDNPVLIDEFSVWEDEQDWGS